LLAQIRRCEVVILLEDDTMPARAGWEDAWIEAANRWGHVNYAGSWLRSAVVSGKGTAANPLMSKRVTAQCAAYAREALSWSGYFDTRFRGFGHEHVEHTRRLIRAGFGGSDRRVGGKEEVLFAVIDGGVEVHPSVSTINHEQVARNLAIAHTAMADHHYRAPWRNLHELRQFRSEINDAIEARPGGFALHASAASSTTTGHSRPFGLARWFHRRT
jgi:hypothetical protein